MRVQSFLLLMKSSIIIEVKRTFFKVLLKISKGCKTFFTPLKYFQHFEHKEQTKRKCSSRGLCFINHTLRKQFPCKSGCISHPLMKNLFIHISMKRSMNSTTWKIDEVSLDAHGKVVGKIHDCGKFQRHEYLQSFTNTTKSYFHLPESAFSSSALHTLFQQCFLFLLYLVSMAREALIWWKTFSGASQRDEKKYR